MPVPLIGMLTLARRRGTAVESLRRRPWILAALGYIVIVVLLLAPSIRPGRTLLPADALLGVAPYGELRSGAVAHNPLPSDAPLQFYPFLKFFGDEAREGRSPQWNPRILGGTVMSPNGFFSTHYPPVLLARWMAAFDVYNAFVAMHLVVAALGSYALARRFRAPPVEAWIVGALALCAAIWIHWSLHLVHLAGMVWLPFVLAAAHRAVHRPGPSSVAALGITFGLWWLGGNPQFCYYGTLALLAATTLFLAGRIRSKASARSRGRSLLTTGAGLLLGVLLAGPTLVPTAAISSQIVREREPVESTSATHLRAPELAELLVPEVGGSPVGGVEFQRARFGGHQMDTPFIGVTTLILAMTGAASLWRRSRAAVLLLGLGVLVLTLGFTGPPHRVLHNLLPGYDRFRASSRWLAVVPALVVPAAALGLAALLEGRRRAKIAAMAVSGATSVGLAAIVAVVLSDPSAPKRFMLTRFAVAVVPIAGCGLAAALSPSRRRLALTCIAAAAAVEIVFLVPRWYPSVVEAAAYPPVQALEIAAERGGRLLRAGPRVALPSLAPNIPMAYGVDEAQGLAVLFPKTIDRYLRNVDDYGSSAIGANTAPPVEDLGKLASPLLKALDVRTVIVDGPQAPGGAASLLASGSPAVYGIESSGPAVVVREARPVPAESMWSAIADPAWDPTQTATVAGLGRRVIGSGGTAVADRARPDDEIWRVAAPDGGLLRVSAAWHQGWHATVDGRRVEVLRADGLFRSVVVPPGEHVVRFRFRNQSELTGRKLAIVGLAVVAALGVASILERRRRPKSGVKRAGWWRWAAAGPETRDHGPDPVAALRGILKNSTLTWPNPPRGSVRLWTIRKLSMRVLNPKAGESPSSGGGAIRRGPSAVPGTSRNLRPSARTIRLTGDL